MNLEEKLLGMLTEASYALLSLPPSAFPPLEKHPFALEKRAIMHPFLGEMGLEIRGFLGRIEPWLRSGWIIPARRPGLYPAATAFSDPVYFDRVNEIKAAHGLREMVGRLENKTPLTMAALPEIEGDLFKLTLSGNIPDGLLPLLTARRDLRRAFYDRYGHDDLPPTRWHSNLSSQSYADDDFEENARWVIAPGYLPFSFTQTGFDFPRHIGVQLRNVLQNPSRNSDPERMGRLAAEAAAILGLPVLVYGRGEDFALPNIQRTLDFVPPDVPQMNAELAFLKHCALMIAPDSGWADLMGWLRVPTLLERLFFPWGFEGLRAFSPRIALADENDLRGCIAAVTASDAGCLLPDCRRGEVANDFLNPGGAACREEWRVFMAER